MDNELEIEKNKLLAIVNILTMMKSPLCRFFSQEKIIENSDYYILDLDWFTYEEITNELTTVFDSQKYPQIFNDEIKQELGSDILPYWINSISQLLERRPTRSLLGSDFNDIQQFFFDREVVGSNLRPWYLNRPEEKVDFCPNIQINFFIKQLNDSKDLLALYEIKQVENGVMAFVAPALRGNLIWLIENYVLTFSISKKIELISSIEQMFLDLFSKTQLGMVAYVWWEYIFLIAPKNWSTDDEESKIIKTQLFKTLSNILKINSSDCQISALRGFKYSKINIDKKGVYQDFIESNKKNNSSAIDYAQMLLDRL